MDAWHEGSAMRCKARVGAQRVDGIIERVTDNACIRFGVNSGLTQAVQSLLTFRALRPGLPDRSNAHPRIVHS